MRHLNLTKHADKFLESLSPKQFKQVLTKLLDLRNEALPHDVAKLHGYNGLYRIDTGEYRIVYSFDEKVIFIHEVGKRNDDEIYKNLKNRNLN